MLNLRSLQNEFFVDLFQVAAHTVGKIIRLERGWENGERVPSVTGKSSVIPDLCPGYRFHLSEKILLHASFGHA